MTRSLIPSLIFLLACSLSFTAGAAEKGFVNFETGEIVEKVPPDQADMFGEIRNKRQPANDIDPIAVGNFWVYESHSKIDGQEFPSKFVLRITKQVEIDGETWFEYQVGNDEPQYRQRIDDEALYFKEPSKQAYKLIARKPQANEKYTNEGGDFTVTATDKVIDSHWGKLKCVELVNIHDDLGALPRKERITDTIWYHPGVGVVAIDGPVSLVKLIGFNVSH